MPLTHRTWKINWIYSISGNIFSALKLHLIHIWSAFHPVGLAGEALAAMRPGSRGCFGQASQWFWSVMMSHRFVFLVFTFVDFRVCKPKHHHLASEKILSLCWSCRFCKSRGIVWNSFTPESCTAALRKFGSSSDATKSQMFPRVTNSHGWARFTGFNTSRLSWTWMFKVKCVGLDDVKGSQTALWHCNQCVSIWF